MRNLLFTLFFLIISCSSEDNILELEKNPDFINFLEEVKSYIESNDAYKVYTGPNQYEATYPLVDFSSKTKYPEVLHYIERKMGERIYYDYSRNGDDYVLLLSVGRKGWYVSNDLSNFHAITGTKMHLENDEVITQNGMEVTRYKFEW